MSVHNCVNNEKCKCDKMGICIKCRYDYTYHRIQRYFVIFYSFLTSIILVASNHDVSIIFPNSFLSSVISNILESNKILGFIAMFFVFYILFRLISPILLLPIEIARTKRCENYRIVTLLDFVTACTIVGWIISMIIAVNTSKSMRLFRSSRQHYRRKTSK